MCFNSNLVFRGILHTNKVYRWVQKPIVRHSKGETKTIFNSFEIKQWKLDLKNKVISWCEALEGDLSLFCHELITTHDVVFATLYSSIVFFGVTANGIIITIVKKTRTMHTTTNYLLMNLAIADFLTLLFCPGFYDFALHKFQLGSGTLDDIFCKFIAGNAIVCVSFDASVLTLCAIAMERYLGIVKPFRLGTSKLTSLAILSL